MSNDSVFLFKYFCNVEQIYISEWNNKSPITCKNNSHVINLDSIVVVDEISNQQMYIKVKTPSNNLANYRVESKLLNVMNNGINIFDFTWPIDMLILSINLNTIDLNQNDIINCLISPDTVIGLLSQDLGVGSNILKVSQSVILNIKIGYLVSIFNQNTGQSESLGQCIGINLENNEIQIETPNNTIFYIGNMVKISVNNIRNFILPSKDTYNFKNKDSSGSFLPKNTIVRIIYDNKSNVSKTFNFNFDLMY